MYMPPTQEGFAVFKGVISFSLGLKFGIVISILGILRFAQRRSDLVEDIVKKFPTAQKNSSSPDCSHKRHPFIDD